MDLKRRLSLANAATVIIPVVITCIMALAFIFIAGKLFHTDISFANYQRLSQIRLELINSENSILQQSPAMVEEKSFQNGLQARLAAIGGELIVVKADNVLYAPQNFSKIDIAKVLEAGSLEQGNEPVVIGTMAYTVQAITLNFKDGSHGLVLLLAPFDSASKTFTSLLVVIGVTFFLTFVATNLLVAYHFSRSMVVPLQKLQLAAAEISRGNLAYAIAEDGDQEIQALCRDLELMRIKLKDSIHTQLKFEDNRKMLISSISHDLKTPVTSIKGYVEGILDGVANTPAKTERYLHTILTKAQQVDQMIDDLLLYAKLDLNQIPFNFEPTDIAEFLTQCVVENEPELARSQIELSMRNELAQACYVRLDRERMNRVLMNILDNSRKYMREAEGAIAIMLRETPTSIVIEVRDNGFGIKELDLPHIFDRFYRADTARSEIKGSGLGLAIAQQVIVGHDGRIWAVGHGDAGTSVLISLPKV